MIISLLTGNFLYSAEFQAFFMALQGVMKVRNGTNKNGKLNWFHAFIQGVVLSYAGGLFTPFWMGRATSMLSNDLNMASCIITYFLVNCIPLNVGYTISSLFPIRLATVVGAQRKLYIIHTHISSFILRIPQLHSMRSNSVFRTMGIITFVNIAYQTFKDSPSSYYPTPVFGPILFGTILGNMGSFFALGFDGHLRNGMSLPIQNGLLVSSLYHFVVNDDGPIGVMLRNLLQPFTMELGHKEFIICFVSLFMQGWAILQMPEFCGSSFNPFNILSIGTKWKKTRGRSVEVPFMEEFDDNDEEKVDSGNNSKHKKKNKRKKKKVKQT